MEMNMWKEGSILIVQPMEKRIDSLTAADFKRIMIGVINKGNDKIALDLSNVDFVDSTGLSAIISVFKSIGNNGVFTICCLSDIVKSMFTLTHMNRLFNIFPSVEEAVAVMRE